MEYKAEEINFKWQFGRSAIYVAIRIFICTIIMGCISVNYTHSYL